MFVVVLARQVAEFHAAAILVSLSAAGQHVGFSIPPLHGSQLGRLPGAYTEELFSKVTNLARKVLAIPFQPFFSLLNVTH